MESLLPASPTGLWCHLTHTLSLPLPKCPVWDWEQKPGVQAGPSHSSHSQLQECSQPLCSGVSPAGRAKGGTCQDMSRGQQCPLCRPCRGSGRAGAGLSFPLVAALPFRPAQAKSGAAAFPKMVKASREPLAAAQRCS